MKSESEVAQSCPILSDPIYCSPPGSSIHGIFQARVLEWGAIDFSGILEQCESIWEFAGDKPHLPSFRFYSPFASASIGVISLCQSFLREKHVFFEAPGDLVMVHLLIFNAKNWAIFETLRISVYVYIKCRSCSPLPESCSLQQRVYSAKTLDINSQDSESIMLQLDFIEFSQYHEDMMTGPPFKRRKLRVSMGK